MVLLLMQKNDNDDPGADDLHRVGTVAIIRQMAKGQGGMRVLVEGVARARAEFLQTERGHMTALIKALPESVRAIARDRRARAAAAGTGGQGAVAGHRPLARHPHAGDARSTIRCASPTCSRSLLDMKPEDKQRLLEENSITIKLDAVASALAREIDVLELKGQIESRAEKEMTDAQRQYVLRQQLKAIQSELGEGDGESQELRKRIADANLPEHVAAVANREVDRLERMTPAAPEYQMIRTYLDWLLEVPWAKRTEDRLDPVEARKRARRGSLRSRQGQGADRRIPRGPQAEGGHEGSHPLLRRPARRRQDVARPVDRAVDEPQVRAHLARRRARRGGDPRPSPHLHRLDARTAGAGAAARPARSTRCCMLDEIDKISVGVQGDPAAALLEVLDPAQNHTFRDHYLEVPLDLSNVLFIATANQLGTIHPALLDRMEIITLSGYTEEEKVHIAKMYLVPRQREEHGLKPEQLVDRRRGAAAGDRRVHARGGRPLARAADRHPRAQGRGARRDRSVARRPRRPRRTCPTISARRASDPKARSGCRGRASPPASRGPKSAATCSTSKRCCCPAATAISR